jgi:hypothetical protein
MRVEEMRPEYIIQSEEEVFVLARRYFGLYREPSQSSRPESSFTHNVTAAGEYSVTSERSC